MKQINLDIKQRDTTYEKMETMTYEELAKNYGIDVEVYTVNSINVARDMFYFGAQGITTDTITDITDII